MRDTPFCRESFRAADTFTCPAALQQGLWLVRMQSQSVHPSVVNGDGDVVTDSFKDGVIHAVLVEVLDFKKAAGMVMFNEKADAKGVMKAVYNNPLEMWRNKTIEFLYLARVARRIQAIPTKQD